MATDVADEVETDPEQPEETERKRKFQLSKKAKILLLLVLVMAVEAGGFLLLVPSAGQATDEVDGADVVDIKTVEVPIDTFRTSNANAAEGSLFSIDFKLTAVVAQDQEAIFKIAATKEHKSRVKYAVESVIARASLKELHDPDHSVILRQIKEKINKTLSKSYVNRVIITEFQIIPL
ncbi:MAG: hypothetical protein ACE5KM_18470 [Planctomycetaceae bacterium]